MSKRFSVSLVILLASVGFFWVDLPLKLRAVNPAVNYAIYSLFCFLVPLSIIALGWALRRVWFRVVAIVLVVIVGLPSGFLGILAFDNALRIQRLGYDPALEFLTEVTAGDYRYRLYRTNCGATCAFGLELRKEQFLPFSVKLIRPIWSFYGAEDGKLALSATEIEVSYEGRVARVPQ